MTQRISFWLLVAWLLFPLRPCASDSTGKNNAELREYFGRVAARLNREEPAQARSLANWQSRRSTLRRELFDMLGLWPMPPKTELCATITGKVEKDGIVVEKLHFQSLPELYVTANFYRPVRQAGPLPAILYLCGHSLVKHKGVSFGNKVNYQHHAAWFARNGYCCLVIDSLQLGEIEGIHHGTHSRGMWWWICRGYTPAGVEALNAIRSIDYLETRREVDGKRIGVTGRSGGGIYSWWLAALDDRPACFAPVAGITDLQNYVVDNCIEGHCDCMFMVNSRAWDFASVSTLATPRPVLLCNSDKDSIFPLDGVLRIHNKLRNLYALHNAKDKLGLVITEGPHSDSQELQIPAFRWMNRWLRQTAEPITAIGEKPFSKEELKVFDKLPANEKNTSIHETFTPAAKVPPPPQTIDEWNGLRSRYLKELLARSFRGWPKTAPDLDAKVVRSSTAGPFRLDVIEFTSDENLRLPLYVVRRESSVSSKRMRAKVLDDSQWRDWLSTHAPLMSAVAGDEKKSANTDAIHALEAAFGPSDEAQVVIVTRGIGPKRWDFGDKTVHVPRRFVLLGKTIDEGRIWDTRRALAVARTLPALESAAVHLQGAGPAAGIALYAGLFEPAVERFELNDLAVSHRTGPILIDVLKVLDVPHAVALAFPRAVTLSSGKRTDWTWPESVAKLYGSDGHAPILELTATNRSP